jgi:putative DNA primase/helicase
MSLESQPHAQDCSAPRPLLEVQREQIPQELLSYPQWVCWQYVYVDRGTGKKPTKQPVNPRTLHSAGVHWPNTWTSFEQAYATYRQYSLSGIGFVLTPDDPFVAVDLDNCVTEEGIAEPALEIIYSKRSR